MTRRRRSSTIAPSDGKRLLGVPVNRDFRNGSTGLLRLDNRQTNQIASKIGSPFTTKTKTGSSHVASDICFDMAQQNISGLRYRQP